MFAHQLQPTLQMLSPSAPVLSCMHKSCIDLRRAQLLLARGKCTSSSCHCGSGGKTSRPGMIDVVSATENPGPGAYGGSLTESWLTASQPSESLAPGFGSSIARSIIAAVTSVGATNITDTTSITDVTSVTGYNKHRRRIHRCM